MSCAVTDPNALPVSPVSNVKTNRVLPMRRASFLSVVQLACFAFSALLLKRIKLAQSRRCNFVRHFARQKIIARITATHLDHVRLGAEPGNIFGQDEFSQWHIDVWIKVPGPTTIKPPRALSMHH